MSKEITQVGASLAIALALIALCLWILSRGLKAGKNANHVQKML